MKSVLLALATCALLVCGVYALPGWNGTRVQINVTSSDIPASLSNFPVLMHLAGSPGKIGVRNMILSGSAVIP